jgi:uncharacterized protein YfaS (alpha-2-macroglobulin family)
MNILTLNRRAIGVYFLFFAVLFFSACGRKNHDVSTLTKVNPYVYAYTSGVISKAASVRVRFNADAAPNGSIGKAADNVLSFSPSIPGTATWEDARTLIFKPNQDLESGTTYQANLRVNSLIKEAKGENANFAFSFHTRDQYMQVDLDGMRPVNNRDLSKQVVKGTVFTADVAPSDAVEKTVTATQNNQNLSVTWEHSNDRLVHFFTVKSVSRAKGSDSKVELDYNGKALEAKNSTFKGESYLIPALEKFVVMDAKVVQTGEPYVQVLFSDPISKEQNLAGLFQIGDFAGGLKYIVEDNTVRIYPDQTLKGDYRLRVNESVTNINNKKLQGPAEWDLNFEENKPQVRLVGDGVILPNSNGLLFPFEAVGLQSVDIEVFKIFNSNILQFLQDNPLDGNYDLVKVGRVIVQKKVDLQTLSPAAKAGIWSRYAIDLSQLIQQDEQAIYQVRIGFRPDYATMGCMKTAGDKGLAGDPFANADADNDDELSSIMDFYYGPDGYSDNYDYDKRDDPCSKEYYNSDHFVQRNVISSNLGLIAKRGGNGEVMVVVTDLRSTDPISGAAVEIFDFQQQSIGKGSSDGDGIAMVKTKGKPYVAVVKQGNQRGYIRLADGDAQSVSRFDVAGAVTQKGLKGLIYAERGVWRPGDSIFLNFMLDDRDNRLPDNYPVSMEVYDARGQLRERRTTAQEIGGIYALPLSTRAEDPTGNWRVKVKAGGASFERLLKIETVKPNRLKIDLEFGAETLSSANDPLNAVLQSDWLTGSPASGLRAVVEVQLRATTTQFSKYPTFQFDDPTRKLASTEARVLFDGTLDNSGKANIRGSLLNNQDAPGMLSAAFRTRVFERGGDFSTDNQTIAYSPYKTYAGVEIPMNKYGEPRIEVGKNGGIRLVSVDGQGRPQASHALSVSMYSVDWRWWWDQGDDNVAQYNTNTGLTAIQNADLTTNGRGEVTWNVSPNKWGRYLIRVSDPASGHSCGSFLYVGYPWYDDGGDNTQAREMASMLGFSASKETYQVGETATLTIPAGKQGRILVSLENGTKIIKTFWASSKAGENKVEFKVTKDMSPTVYANVALIQPHAQVNNDLPLRLYGIIPIGVNDPETELQPVLGMASEFQPEQTVSVEVSEKSGKAMAYTLALVDEGLLGLTRFKVPNPRNSFYAREALGVRTWDIFDKVLGAFSGQLDRILTIGGDEAVNPGALNNTANRFEPVVRYLGPFELGRGDKKRHSIKLPNYIGAVRVMVVAASNGAYGAAEKSVPVRSPLMVRVTLPRVIAPGDEFEIPVNVIVNDQKISEVQYKVQESNGLASIETVGKAMRFSSGGGDQINGVKVKMNNKTGVAKFLITAQGNNGKTAKEEIEVQVRNPNPYQTQVYAEVVEPGKDWQSTITALGTPGTRTAMLEVSNIPPLNLGERLNYLMGYPYGCIEQTLSAGFPQLYLSQLMDLDQNRQKQITSSINATIERLKLFQTAEGGFTYWPGTGNPDQWATSFAGHFLLEAKSKGYTVPQNLLSDWTKFQRKASRLWDAKMPAYGFGSQESHDLNQAYRLYTLALAGAPDNASMNRLRENANLKTTARWRLAAAYALIGKTDAAKGLIQDQSTDVADYTEMSYTYGSGLRDRAMILETLLLLKDTKKAGSVVQYISSQLSSSSWFATQTISYALMAVSKFVGDNKVSQSFSFTYQVASGKTVSAGSRSPLMQIQLPSGSAGNLAFTNTSKAKLFARVILRGQPAPGEESAQSNDLNLSIAFKNSDGSTLDPGNIQQGKDFIAEVKVTHPGMRPIFYKELGLQQIFPAGWEILNNRLGDLQGTAQSGFDYQDIRDDRVNTFFDLREKETKVFRVQLNAAYAGRFFLPATLCEAMYDNSVSANTRGQWVQVTAR